MRKLFSYGLSLAVSACLLSGVPVLVEFGIWVAGIFMVISAIGIFTVRPSDKVYAEMRQEWFVSVPFSVLRVAALLVAGYPIWAAVGVLVAICHWAKAYSGERQL